MFPWSEAVHHTPVSILCRVCCPLNVLGSAALPWWPSPIRAHKASPQQSHPLSSSSDVCSCPVAVDGRWEQGQTAGVEAAYLILCLWILYSLEEHRGDQHRALLRTPLLQLCCTSLVTWCAKCSSHPTRDLRTLILPERESNTINCFPQTAS